MWNSWILWQCDGDGEEAKRQFLKLIAPVKLDVPCTAIDRPAHAKTLECFMQPRPDRAIQVPSYCKGWDEADKYIKTSNTTQVLCLQCPQGCVETDDDVRQKCGISYC